MKPNTLIIGAGAVGLGIGSCLAKSTDWPITFLTRPGGADSLRDTGINRFGIFGDHRAAAERYGVIEAIDAAPPGQFDLILVCTKTFDSEPVAEQLAAHKSILGPDSKIVLFHNGWGTADIFAARFPRKKIFNARVITGFRRPDRSSVEITVHADDIRIGSIYYPESSPQLASLAQAISTGGIPAQISGNVSRDLWAKLLYNCALNPLAAILNATYGALGDSPHTRLLMDQIIEEIYQVMAAHGYSTHWDDAAGFKQAFYSTMIPRTYVHESSMLQDIRAGRKTEIDYLAGAVVQLGESKKVAVPANKFVFQQIAFIEDRNSSDQSQIGK